eukprot:gene1442-1672_t
MIQLPHSLNSGTTFRDAAVINTPHPARRQATNGNSGGTMPRSK